MKKIELPIIKVVVEAQPWPQDHVARITSVKVKPCENAVSRKKIQSYILES